MLGSGLNFCFGLLVEAAKPRGESFEIDVLDNSFLTKVNISDTEGRDFGLFTEIVVSKAVNEGGERNKSYQ